jgi:hypothetical protein
MNKASTSMSHPSSGDQDGTIVDQATQAVTHVASNLSHQAREQVNTQFDTRKDKAVETMSTVATAIRETGDKLKGVGPLGDVAGRAADGIEKVADFFEGKHISDVVRDVESFARREPALFIGAALAVGLIGGRFLKSSAHRSSDLGQGIGADARQRTGTLDLDLSDVSRSRPRPTAQNHDSWNGPFGAPLGGSAARSTYGASNAPNGSSRSSLPSISSPPKNGLDGNGNGGSP